MDLLDLDLDNLGLTGCAEMDFGLYGLSDIDQGLSGFFPFHAKNNPKTQPGFRNGKITVVKTLPNKRGAYLQIFLKCDCGFQYVMPEAFFLKHIPTMCRNCLRCSKTYQVGSIIGKLTIIGKPDPYHFRVLCECGRTVVVDANAGQRSCGCENGDRKLAKLKRMETAHEQRMRYLRSLSDESEGTDSENPHNRVCPGSQRQDGESPEAVQQNPVHAGRIRVVVVNHRRHYARVKGRASLRSL